MNMKEYYDKCIRKEDEGRCLHCGKETKFYGYYKGYAKFCCLKHQQKSEYVRNKIIESFKTRDVDKENEKRKKTCLKKYGVNSAGKISKSINKAKIRNKAKAIQNINNIINELGQKISLVEYLNKSEVRYYCEVCKQFFELDSQILYDRYRNKENICLICNPFGFDGISKLENELKDFIKINYTGLILLNDRNILKGKELDIYLPDLKIAFEFNGIEWHNEKYKDKNYHLDKTNKCEEKGIHLVHIYEDDWVFKQDIVKSRILNLLGKSKKIFARKTEIKEVSYKDSKEFLEKNHIQGNCVSKIRLGLYYDNELVSLMTFGKLRKCLGNKSGKGLFELIRFCNKLNTTVVGGAQKLFKHFLREFTPKEVISYADRSWTMNNGNTLYDKIGFKLYHISKSNYYYIVNRRREGRFKYRKNVLVEQGFDVNKSEHEIMLKRGLFRIYDSGSIKYEFKNKHEIIE